jgi:hypothetical protein
MNGFRPIILAVTLLTLGCAQAGPEDEADRLSPDMRTFLDEAIACEQTVCELDFTENETCQKAWGEQAQIESQTASDGIAYLQARLALNRAYEKALERRLGQSAYSHIACGVVVKPLAPLNSTSEPQG